jgi:hypothetical protein
MAFRVGQANFSKGEIADDLIGRIDVPAYATALRRARNVIVLKYGGITKRPGTRFVAEALDSVNPVRVIPFQFTIQQTYALEMGQGYMRSAALGGMILEQKLTITALTLGITTTVAAAYHGYAVGDRVYFSSVAGSDDINGRFGTVAAVPDDSHFVVDIDSRTFQPFTGDSDGITRVATPAPPPPPPPVPTPAPDPTPPPVGGGGGGGRIPPGGQIP